eukprot:Awhi_evm1s12373
MSKGNVSVVGIGALGICLALSLERAGYNVVGVDIFADYCKALNDKTFPAKEPRVAEFLQESKNFRATTNLQEAIDHTDGLLFILVQTPSTSGERHYDTSAVAKVLLKAAALGAKDIDFIVGCTVMPGWCQNVGVELIKETTNCTISYNPEFIAQGDIINGMLNPDMVLIGEYDTRVGDKLEEVYLNVCDNKPVISRMSTSSAEICKLGVNCFVTTKISYANMIGDIADRTVGACKKDILAAVGADSRVGTKYLKPGYSYGGPCFPRDNRALGGYAEFVGVQPIIPVATDAYNKYHTKLMAETLLDQNLDHYVFEDVAYKPDCAVPIVEESAKIEIARILVHKGKKVTIRDRQFIVDACRVAHGNKFTYEVVESFSKKN